ncbi:MAG: 1,2-phenylacetyl-CoA epoxidase subunit PaaC, partial [Flavisolibacter sp.]
DDLAFLRDEHQFLNLLISELPRGDWAQSVLRQFFFSAYQFYLYEALQHSSDTSLSAIAEKSLKETTYHLRWSGEWVIRLGDGTEESRSRLLKALADQWMFTGEMFKPVSYEASALEQLIPGLPELQQSWLKKIEAVFNEAGIEIPTAKWTQSGGKEGRHTEYLGFLLAEMQTLQRAYPNATW